MTRIKSSGESNTKVLLLTSYYEPAYLGGGPIQTLKALVREAPEHFDLRILCNNHDLGSREPLVGDPNVWKNTENARIMYVSGGLKKIYSALKSSKDADIIYFNSFFEFRFTIFPLLLLLAGRWTSGKILLAPRGELDPGALAIKSKKKDLYIHLFKLFKIQKKLIWHASNKLEEANISNVFGKNLKIVIREDETSLEHEANLRDYRVPGDFRLVFASRLTEKKGLHILLESLKDVSLPVELSILGAFENSDYEKRCREIAKRLSGNIKVTFYGPLKRDLVLKHFHAADLFAFPTAGENFGHVISEALSQSCPVMCSEFTSWNSILEKGGGSIVNSLNPMDWSVSITNYIVGGPSAWEKNCLVVKDVYNQWRSDSKGEHVFNLTISMD